MAAELPKTEVVDIDQLIKDDAKKYHINYEHLYQTLKCESGNFTDVAIRGDNGLARGLAQIRSDYHSEVTDAQADDPVFAIDFIAKAFANGHANEWTCFRTLFSGHK